jgi:hypothetical protein
MKEKEMKLIAKWIGHIIFEIAGDYSFDFSNKKIRQSQIDRFRKEIENHPILQMTHDEVVSLAHKFPLYPKL